MPPNHGDEGAGPDPGAGGGVRVEVVDRAAGGVCTIQSVSSCLIGGVCNGLVDLAVHHTGEGPLLIDNAKQ